MRVPPGFPVLDAADHLLPHLDQGTAEVGGGRVGYLGRPARQPRLQGDRLLRPAPVLHRHIQVDPVGRPVRQMPAQAGQLGPHLRPVGLVETLPEPELRGEGRLRAASAYAHGSYLPTGARPPTGQVSTRAVNVRVASQPSIVTGSSTSANRTWMCCASITVPSSRPPDAANSELATSTRTNSGQLATCTLGAAP